MMTAKLYEIYVGHKNLYFSVTYAELVHGVEKSQAGKNRHRPFLYSFIEH